MAVAATAAIFAALAVAKVAVVASFQALAEAAVYSTGAGAGGA